MPKKRDLQGVRVHNRRLVFDAVKDAKATSRIDLARCTGLCAATVGFIVDDLLKRRLIVESGKQEAAAGRKATVVKLDPTHWRFVGIDLWHKVIRVMTMDLSYRVIGREEIPMKRRLTPAEAMRHIIRMIRDVGEETGGTLGAIGVSVEGTVHPWTGAVTSWMWLKGKEFDVRRRIEERYHVPVVAENVDRINAWAEYGRNQERAENILCFGISTGVGAGVVAKGAIYRGAAAAGDIAHTRIADTGPRCTLGHRGCLEGFISEKTILRDMGRLARQKVDVADIDNLCRSNVRVTRLLEERADMASTALAYMIGSLHPGLLVLTGPLFQQSEKFFGLVKRGIEKRAPLKEWKWPKVRRSTFGGGQMQIGMADLLWRAFCDREFRGAH